MCCCDSKTVFWDSLLIDFITAQPKNLAFEWLVSKISICILKYCFYQVVEGLPDVNTATVLSFLSTRDICRCACIAKEWAFCAHRRLIEMKEEIPRTRDQVNL